MDNDVNKNSRATKMAPYILKSGKWTDANTNLDIRDIDSLSNATNSKVPRVYALKSGKWDQIYPPSEQPGGGSIVISNDLKCWMGSTTDKRVLGWAYGDGTTNSWCAGHGYFGDGSYSWETETHQEFAGWTGVTLASLRNAGYKGLGTKDKPGGVKKVNKVILKTNHKRGTGYTAFSRKLGIVLSNVANPFKTPRPGATHANNPFVNDGRRTPVMYSDNSSRLASNEPVPEPNNWNTWVFTNPTVLNHFKDFLNGKWDNLLMLNGSNPSNTPKDEIWFTDGSGAHRALYMTMNYFKTKGFQIQIDYIYEPQ